MAQTIESFVQKLQAQGVEAGKQEAQKLRREAEAQAAHIVADAQAQAAKIIADAEAQARQLSAQQQHELELASRDALLRLRKGIIATLDAVLRYKATQALSDPQFLPQLIHDIVVQYAEQDGRLTRDIEINVSPQNVQTVTDWAIGFIGQHHKDHEEAPINLKGTLKSAGFEYRVEESTVEVTVDAVTDVLRGLVTPRLRELLEQAAADAKAQ